MGGGPYTTVTDHSCAEDGCHSKLYARNRCKKHYNEYRKWNGSGNLKPMTCIQCKTVFYVEPYYVDIAETCSKQCQAENHSKRMKKPKVRWACLYCGTYYTPPRRESKYCSQTCAIEVFAENARQSVGERSPKWVSRKTFICSFCGSQFEDIETANRVTCSPECNNEFNRNQDVMECAVCGRERTMQASVARNQITCSRECRTVWIGKGNTYIEQEIERILQEECFNYCAQYPINTYTADFYLPDYYLVIECDGDYWHSLPQVRKKDRRRDAFMRSKEYNILRLPEHKIKEDPELCRNLIYCHTVTNKVMVYG